MLVEYPHIIGNLQSSVVLHKPSWNLTAIFYGHGHREAALAVRISQAGRSKDDDDEEVLIYH